MMEVVLVRREDDKLLKKTPFYGVFFFRLILNKISGSGIPKPLMIFCVNITFD